MSSGVKLWWIVLCGISLVNIIAWMYSARVFVRRKAIINTAIFKGRRLMLWLSGGYVLGCAFRSFLPRIDLERICLVDSWLSSMIVGRSVATVAELCFIAQCAVLLREAGMGAGDRFSVNVAYALIPMILVAECFSWYAIISTHYLGSVVEESLWTIAGILLVMSFVSLWPRVRGNQRYFLVAMILFGIGFVVFMVTVDVPLYWYRWQLGVAEGVKYLSFGQGLLDMTRRYIVNFDWQVWHDEIPWMTLYFTAAVWVSIYLTHAPNFKMADKRGEGWK